MILTRTPLRISIGGGGTDLPFYYRREGGFLVTATMDSYIYCMIEDRLEEGSRVSYLDTVERGDLSEIENGRIRNALQDAGVEENVEISVVSEIPSGSGVGSSGAFTVGMLNAAFNYKGVQMSYRNLAEKAFEIEHERLGEPCGKQDQYAASIGGINLLEIDKDGETKVSPLDIDQETVKDLERNLELFYTGQLRDSSDVLEDQKKKALSEEEKMDKMRRIKQIGKKIKNALESGDPDRFGDLLHEHWTAKKKFTDKMSDNEIDEAYSKAMELGARGGKIMGAGGGGFFLFYVDEDRERFREEMQDIGLKRMDFSFDHEGTTVVKDV